MQNTPVISNLNVYLAIANEALDVVQRLDKTQRKPKPDGQPGFIITYDPKRTSFKRSLIAIVFAGIYLEALLYMEAKTRFSKSRLKDFDRPRNNYETKLQLLGLHDIELLSDCKRFRESRNDLVHEKALELPSNNLGRVRAAQTESTHAVTFVRRVKELLRELP